MAISTRFTILLILISTTLCSAEIRSLKIRDDERPIIMLDDFGFTNRGRLELNISWISLSFRNNPLLDLSNNVGFFLYAHNSSRHTLKSEAATYCPPELRRDKGKDKIHKGLLLSPNLSNNTLVYHNETDPGHRVLIFVNCIEGMNVSMDIQWAMYNVLDGGNVRDYLPVGLSVLPR
ncbi:Lung seven transmembrane receptor-like, partial [Trema orientale]